MSFDLIYMPYFMKAGFLTNLTADLKANPNFASVAKAYVDITPDEQNGRYVCDFRTEQSGSPWEWQSPPS